MLRHRVNWIGGFCNRSAIFCCFCSGVEVLLFYPLPFRSGLPTRYTYIEIVSCAPPDHTNTSSLVAWAHTSRG